VSVILVSCHTQQIFKNLINITFQVEKVKLPIGVLPVGKENRMAKNLFPASANFTEARLMAEATM
jgi:hypothetical protein